MRYRSLEMVSVVQSEHMPAVLCHYQWSLLLVGSLYHYLRYHNVLVFSRNTRICLYLSMPRGGSWCGKWHEAQYLRLQSPPCKTLRQSKVHNHAEVDRFADNSLYHYLRYHNVLVFSRNTRICLYLSMPRGGSWCGKWHEAQYLRLQSPPCKTLRQSKVHNHAEVDRFADNITVSEKIYGYCVRVIKSYSTSWK